MRDQPADRAPARPIGQVGAARRAQATVPVPAMPRFGSVGASGDLIPLVYAAQSLRGRGWAYVDGERMPADAALRRVGAGSVAELAT